MQMNFHNGDETSLFGYKILWLLFQSFSYLLPPHISHSPWTSPSQLALFGRVDLPRRLGTGQHVSGQAEGDGWAALLCRPPHNLHLRLPSPGPGRGLGGLSSRDLFLCGSLSLAWACPQTLISTAGQPCDQWVFSFWDPDHLCPNSWLPGPLGPHLQGMLCPQSWGSHTSIRPPPPHLVCHRYFMSAVRAASYCSLCQEQYICVPNPHSITRSVLFTPFYRSRNCNLSYKSPVRGHSWGRPRLQMQATRPRGWCLSAPQQHLSFRHSWLLNLCW